MRDNSAVAESFADMAAAAKHGSLHTDKGGNTVGCSSPSIRNEVAMYIMYLAVKQLRYDRTKIIHSLTKEIRYVLSEIPGASSSDSLRSQISLISEKQTKLLDLYMNDEIGKDEYTRERTRFETEIQELKMQIIGRECAGTLKKDSDLLYDDIVKVINELADGVEYD